VTSNPKKIGKSIYNIRIDQPDSIAETKNGKVLVAITQRNSIDEIKGFLNKLDGCQSFYF